MKKRNKILLADGFRMLKKRYICIKQHDTTDCAAACLAMIARYYGLSMSIAKIREIAGTDKEGTNAYGVVKASEKIGMTAKAVKGDNKALTSNFTLPAIAHVIKNDSLYHYIVIYKITSKHLIVADPAEGVKKCTVEEFLSQWTGVLILMMPSTNFIKGSTNESVLKRFFLLLIPQKKLILHIFWASLILTAFGILGAFFFQLLIDDILPNNLHKTLNIFCIGLIILSIFKILLNTFREQLFIYLSQRLDIPLILGYYNHVLDLPMNFFGSRKTGETISRFEDASRIKDAISGATLTIMLDTIMVLFYIALVIIFRKPFEELNRKIME